jgi:hypothetical protein
MLPREDLVQALAGLASRSIEGVLYRAIDLEALYGFQRPDPYPQPRPLYGFGAPAHGARFTEKPPANESEGSHADLSAVEEVAPYVRDTAFGAGE